MSKTLKWILGILAVLVVIALAAGAFFLWRNQMTAYSYQRPVRPAMPNAQGTPIAPGTEKGPTAPYGFRMHRPMDGWGGGMPMMGRRGFPGYGFGPGIFWLGGLLHLIIPLGILVLVAIVFYELGKRAGRQTVDLPSSPGGPGPGTPAPARGRKVAKS